MQDIPLRRLFSTRLLAWSILGAGSQAVFGAVTTVILARGLGPEGLGAFGVLLAISTLLSQTGELGLGTAYVRLATPLFRSRSDVRVLTWTFLYVRMIAVGILASLLSVAVLVGWNAHFSAFRALVIPAGIAAILMSVGGHYAEVLRARFRHRAAATTRTLISALRATVYGVLAGTAALNLRTVVLTTVVLTGVESSALAVVGQRGAGLWPPTNMRLERRWVTLSSWLFLASASTLVLSQTDTLLMAALASQFETGLWVAASRLVAPIFLLLAAAWSVVLPVSVALSDVRKTSRYLSLCRRASLVALGVSAAGGILTVPMIRLLFGTSYLDAAEPARWLLLGLGVSAAAVFYGGLVHRLGLEKPLAMVNLTLLVLNGVGDAVLIPIYGAAGCAAVTAGVFLCSSCWAVWKVESMKQRLLGVDPGLIPSGALDVPGVEQRKVEGTA